MASQSTKIVDGGKLLIPARFRREMGLKVGDPVVIEMADGELRVRSRASALANARKLLRQYVPAGVNLSDDLISDRRAEEAKD